MTTLLLHLSDVDEAAWARRYAEVLPGVTVVRQTDSFDPAAIDYVLDKVEGFAIDRNGDAYVVTDNDGVDDSSGETLFLRLGNISAVN